MKDRIRTILDKYQINQTEFCNKTGIKKSALSHIMSKNGRGGSLSEFNIDKIIKAFPNVNKTWLVTGRGTIDDINKYEQTSMLLYPDNEEEIRNIVKENDIKTSHFERSDKPKDTIIMDFEDEQFTHDAKNREEYRDSITINKQKEKDKKIERIVIFYNDGTFTNHIPQE